MRSFTSNGIQRSRGYTSARMPKSGRRAPKLHYAGQVRPGRKFKSIAHVNQLERAVGSNGFKIPQGLSKAAAIALITLYSVSPTFGLTACSSGGSGGGDSGGNHQPVDDDSADDDTGSQPDDDTQVDDDTGVDDDTFPDDDTTPDDDTDDDDDTSPITYSVRGRVADMLGRKDDPIYLSGATVTIGGRTSDPTGGDGSFSVDGLEPGDYLVKVTKSGYNVGNLGKVRVSEQYNQDGRLENLVLEIIPETFDMDFFDEAFRAYGATQRIPDEDVSAWRGYININDAYGSGEEITEDMQNNALQVMEVDWCDLTDGKLCPSRANGRLDVGTNPPVDDTPGNTNFKWYDLGGSSHGEGMDGDSIIYSNASTNTSSSLKFYRHELLQAIGARHDSSDPTSVLYGFSGPDNFNQNDRDSMDVLYSMPPGTTSPHNVSEGHIIN